MFVHTADAYTYSISHIDKGMHTFCSHILDTHACLNPHTHSLRIPRDSAKWFPTIMMTGNADGSNSMACKIDPELCRGPPHPSQTLRAMRAKVIIVL